MSPLIFGSEACCQKCTPLKMAAKYYSRTGTRSSYYAQPPVLDLARYLPQNDLFSVHASNY
jgi:hypothetical protein